MKVTNGDDETQSSTSKDEDGTAKSDANINDDDDDGKMLRLSRNILPKHYNIEFHFRVPVNFDYQGIVSISIRIDSSPIRNIIWLHSHRLRINRRDVSIRIRNDIFSCIEILYRDNGIIGLRFDRKLDPCQDAILTLQFIGKVSRDTLSGIYENPYIDQNGEIRSGIVTLFAATEARTGFPCFDEPDMKATFDISIISDISFKTVLSNMPCLSKTRLNNDGYQRHVFETTPFMSTYLLCLVIGEYDVSKVRLDFENDRRTVWIRVFTPLRRQEQGVFALEVAKRCTLFYNRYFDADYSLPKLDFVALSRLSVGAMENWGLITCRESGLLVDPLNTAPANKQKIATLVAHEISHQWFGNLVTMSWWSDLWLNEGLATFMQYLSICDLFPEYRMFPEQFCVNTTVPALRQDALESSHPIQVPIKDGAEISQVFDRITYCKGASVLRMLHDFLGADVFRDAMRLYMKKYGYGNAQTRDLWDCMSTVSGRDIRKMMKEWTTVKGYPLIRVQHEGTRLVLTQTPFSTLSHGEERVLWTIPVTLRIKRGDEEPPTIHTLLMETRSAEIDVDSLNLDGGNDGINTKSYVQINPVFNGFYRTSYSPRLGDALYRNMSDITESVGRLCLIDDQVSMIMAEDGSTVKLLKMILRLRETETSFVVWQNVCGFFCVLRTFFLNSVSNAVAEIFDGFCVYLMEPCLERIKGGGHITDSHHPDAMLYATLIGQLGMKGHIQTQDEVAKMFKAHVEGTSIIPAALRDAVFKVAVHIGATHFDQMVNLYRDTELAEEKNRILYAMGHFREEDVLMRVLDFSLSEDVQPQESLVAICSVCSNKVGYRIAWSFFTTHFEKFMDRYGTGLFLMERLIKAVTENYSSESILKEVEEFFSARKLPGFERNINQAKETIRLNIVLKNRDSDSVKEFLCTWHRNNKLV